MFRRTFSVSSFIASLAVTLGLSLLIVLTLAAQVAPGNAQVSVTVVAAGTVAPGTTSVAAPAQVITPCPLPAAGSTGAGTGLMPNCPPPCPPPGGPMIPCVYPPPPYPVPTDQVIIQSYQVNTTITDQLAVTQLSLTFINQGARPAEGSNLIPLPSGASVSDLKMLIDGQVVQGQILDANQARTIYEETVRRLRDPALLQYVGSGAIQANVFPIPSGQNRTLQITYSQVLNAQNGLVAYSYPLRADYLSHAPVQQISVSINVTSQESIAAAYSPDPQVVVNRTDDRHVQAGFETTNYLPYGDFQLYYSLANASAGLIDANMLTYRDSADQDGYFMLLLTPPLKVTQDQIVPKDVLIVLDQSGSMQGTKWSQAQGAATFVLNHLNPQDRFNVLTFSTGYRIFANSLQGVDQASAAAQWIQTQQAEGGTDINSALLKVLNMADPSRQTTVLFMTDGQPTEGETDLNSILKNVQAAAGPNVRIFSFGVGDDVNTYLLDSLSSDFHGASVYVRPADNLETAISDLYAKISQPVLTALKLDFGSITVDDLYPGDPLPDLFAGQQLIITGRYRGQGTATVTLTGQQKNQTQTFTFPAVTFPANAGGQPFVARLWATRKIGYILKQIQLHGQTPELVNEVTQLSVRFGIVTPYTSYLIQENSPVSEGGTGGGPSIAAMPTAVAPSAQTGPSAINAAQASGNLAGANAPSANGGSTSTATGNLPLRQIGDRAFVLRGDVWVDTQYMPSGNGTQPQVIQFGSDQYFAFLDAHPDLADVLALGPHVIVVVNGTAYEIKP